jgi:hypothetical protein
MSEWSNIHQAVMQYYLMLCCPQELYLGQRRLSLLNYMEIDVLLAINAIATCCIAADRCANAGLARTLSTTTIRCRIQLPAG